MRKEVESSMEVEEMEMLRVNVEKSHDARAGYSHDVAVTENFHGQTVWQGVVHVFDLAGHPTASIAYAWSSRVEGSDRRRFYAVLGVPPIYSAADAVRAAIVADRKANRS